MRNDDDVYYNYLVRRNGDYENIVVSCFDENSIKTVDEQVHAISVRLN